MHPSRPSSSCTFVCLSQTLTLLKPPFISINDSINDVLIYFSINCTSDDNLTYANVSISIGNELNLIHQQLLNYYQQVQHQMVGGASNMYTAMYGGDIDLSVSMTFSSTILVMYY